MELNKCPWNPWSFAVSTPASACGRGAPVREDEVDEARLVPGARPSHEPESGNELHRARSRLYRSRFLQTNMRLKALAEIHSIHTFAQLFDLKFSFKKNKNCIFCYFFQFFLAKFLQMFKKKLRLDSGAKECIV